MTPWAIRLTGAGSPTGSLAGPEECHLREPCCLYVRVLRDTDTTLEQDWRVPEHCWNNGISKDIWEARVEVPLGTCSVDLLSDLEFLVYKLPKTGWGMTRDEATVFIDRIRGGYLWASVPAEVFITSRTAPQARRDKTKTHEYRHQLTIQWLGAAQAWLQDLDLSAQKRCQKAEDPTTRGRGMIHRTDKYHAQQHSRVRERAPGQVPLLLVLPPRPGMPDDFHSAREPSEFEYDSEETDGAEDDIDGNKQEDDESASVCSDSTCQSSDHDTDRTRQTNTSNRNQRHNRGKHKEHRGRHPTNARKEENKCMGKVVLSLFRDSPKEGTLTYTDWRREVEEYLRKGYNDSNVKDAMLSSVEGQAYVNFRSCDEGRNCMPAQILKEMDSIYNVSVTFRDLNAQMCGLKQGMNEPIKAYYERMVDISVKLEQYHGDRFGPDELSLMKKDCFYVGLKEHNKYLVSYMKDRDQ